MGRTERKDKGGGKEEVEGTSFSVYANTLFIMKIQYKYN